jgi:hypothetical protein
MKALSSVERVREYERAATVIEQFVSGTCGEWDWDDFTSKSSKDAYLDSVRRLCARVRDDYPAANGYCTAQGTPLLLGAARELRERAKELKPA